MVPIRHVFTSTSGGTVARSSNPHGDMFGVQSVQFDYLGSYKSVKVA